MHQFVISYRDTGMNIVILTKYRYIASPTCVSTSCIVNVHDNTIDLHVHVNEGTHVLF